MENLQAQLDEIELLQSMYSAPGEFSIVDSASYEQTLAYCQQLVAEPAQSLSFALTLILTLTPSESEEEEAVASFNHPLEIGIRLDNRYSGTHTVHTRTQMKHPHTHTH